MNATHDRRNTARLVRIVHHWLNAWGGRACLLLCLPLYLTAAQRLDADDSRMPKFVRHIDIVHMTHTDVGFTDHPLVCREQQMRYLDIAIDAVLKTRQRPPEERFAWTAETTLAVNDWWQAAPPERRGEFLTAVDSGQLEIAALPMNQTPTLNRAEWQKALHWLPDDLWDRVQPRVAIQNDVNGFPRAGAMALLDRGVAALLMGINATWGGPPARQPSAFWWKMPDGRRMFVWLGDHYTRGFYYFHPATWRRGPVPESTDTRYRPARPGEFFRSDEASVRAAHVHLLGELQKLEAAGYTYPRVIAPITNEWRMDNDPPFPAMAEFVAAWQRLGLQPDLRMTTVGDALQQMQREIGEQIPEREGEWTDWWANGVASGPREVAASRRAKRLLAAGLAPVWGPATDRLQQDTDTILRDLCLFDEHTWGASDSIGQPHSIDTWGQYNEKSRAAYRPLALAKLLLSRRARTAIYPRPAGLYVVNTAPQPWTGWVTMPASAVRGDYHSLRDPDSGTVTRLIYEKGYQPHARPADPSEVSIFDTSETFPDLAADRQIRFWVAEMDGGTIRRYEWSDERLAPTPAPAAVSVETDEQGWPTSARWPGMADPLFTADTGTFQSVAVTGFAGRWTALDAFNTADSAQRDKMRGELLEVAAAAATEPARVETDAHSTTYTQVMHHPRCRWLVRQLELWNDQPRAKITVRLHRMEGERPEVFLIGFTLPCEGVLPVTSNGGLPFVPYRDQLPGTCRDYFAIDSWLAYSTPGGQWIWVTRDAPLVTFGDHHLLARTNAPPENTHRVLAMVFNNIWFTNFVADSHGALEFQFDLAWKPSNAPATDVDPLAETLQSEPTVVINPQLREDPIFMQRLHR